MSNLARREPDQDYLQLSLFKTEDPKATNYAALYDLAPRHVVYQERSKRYLEAVRRNFRFGGQQYQITLSPARIEHSDGTETDEFPGEREQLVEDVIRNVARVGLGPQDVVAEFTLFDIMRELQRLRHTLSRAEVREALLILNKSSIQITPLDDREEGDQKRKRKPLLSAAPFPILFMRDEHDDEALSHVQLNPLLSQSIKSLNFSQVNYEWMMRLKSSFARWAFKRLSIQMMSEPDAVLREGVIELSAAELAEGWGQTNQQFRDTLRKVSTVIEKLKASGVIEDYGSQDVFKGKSKLDVIYTVKLSPTFIADRLEAVAARQFNIEAATRAGMTGAAQYHPIERAEATRIRHRRRTQAALAAPA